MIQLDNFVMMRWEAEATVVPAESRFHNSFHPPHMCLICASSVPDLCEPPRYINCSHFGFFAPGQVEAVQSLQETQLYQEDFIGDSSHMSYDHRCPQSELYPDGVR